MKKVFIAALAIIIAVVLSVSLLNHESKPTTPMVEAAIQRIKTSSEAVPAPNSVRTNNSGEPHTVGTENSKEDIALRRFIAQSSFLPNHAVASLTVEQRAQLELFLQQSKKVTYELLVEMGKVSRLPDGTLRIEIAAKDAKLDEMIDFVHAGIEKIVGAEHMKSILTDLGPQFEAGFAHFGRYDTTITLAVEEPAVPGAPSYVTMKSEYRRVMMLGVSAGHIRSTSVARKSEFETTYFSLDQLNRRI